LLQEIEFNKLVTYIKYLEWNRTYRVRTQKQECNLFTWNAVILLHLRQAIMSA